MSDASESFTPPNAGWELQSFLQRARRGDLNEVETKWYFDTYVDSLSIAGMGKEWFLAWWYGSPWKFSILGVFWGFIGVFLLFAGTSEFGILAGILGVLFIAYALYLFRGGTRKFFIF